MVEPNGLVQLIADRHQNANYVHSFSVKASSMDLVSSFGSGIKLTNHYVCMTWLQTGTGPSVTFDQYRIRNDDDDDEHYIQANYIAIFHLNPECPGVGLIIINNSRPKWLPLCVERVYECVYVCVCAHATNVGLELQWHSILRACNHCRWILARIGIRCRSDSSICTLQHQRGSSG